MLHNLTLLHLQILMRRNSAQDAGLLDIAAERPGLREVISFTPPGNISLQ